MGVDFSVTMLIWSPGFCLPGTTALTVEIDKFCDSVRSNKVLSGMVAHPPYTPPARVPTQHPHVACSFLGAYEPLMQSCRIPETRNTRYRGYELEKALSRNAEKRVTHPVTSEMGKTLITNCSWLCQPSEYGRRTESGAGTHRESGTRATFSRLVVGVVYHGMKHLPLNRRTRLSDKFLLKYGIIF